MVDEMTELLYVTSVDVSLPNGPGINEIQFILAAAREYGSEVRFVIPEPSRALPDDFPHDRTVTLPRLYRRSPLSWLKHIRAKTRAGRNLVAELDPDYVVIRMSFLPLAEARIASRARSAFVKTAGDGRFVSFQQKFLSRMILPLQKRTYGTVLHAARAVDVVTDIHKDSLETLYPDLQGRVHVFDNVADTDVFHPTDPAAMRQKLGLNKYRYLIGYVGNFAHQRGGRELLDSWQHIEQREDVGLVVISGDGAGVDALRAQAETLGISDRLTVLGPVPFSQVAEHMGMLDIGVSFRDDDGCSELKVRQYLSCGLPVIASAQVNAFMEDADIGRLVPRDDAEAIGRAASDILAGRSCTNREAIRDYALAHLGFAAAIARRRAFWRDQCQKAA